MQDLYNNVLEIILLIDKRNNFTSLRRVNTHMRRSPALSMCVSTICQTCLGAFAFLISQFSV